PADVIVTVRWQCGTAAGESTTGRRNGGTPSLPKDPVTPGRPVTTNPLNRAVTLEGGRVPDDYWLPVRPPGDALVPMLLEPHHGPRESKFVIRPRLNFFTTPSIAIAITGMRGTGKSTLLKALRRRLRVGGYEQRGESPKAEPDRFVARTEYGKKQVQVVVVPGQHDSPQPKPTLPPHFHYPHPPTAPPP